MALPPEKEMEIFFYIFALLAIVAAMSVILQRTPVYSALSLIVVLASLAVIFLMLGAPFIAMVQVIVYAGAIMVLFVLVIMLLNAGHEGPSRHHAKFARWAGPPLLLAFVVEFVILVWKHFGLAATENAQALDASPAAIGRLLFRSYVLPFEVTSILILVAVLGAVVLAKKNL
jgi:NADH-quinone oxidoreductase subunit J